MSLSNFKIYKCLNELAPIYICNFSHPVHLHETGFSRNNLVIPKCHLCTGQRAFNYKGVMTWNGLSIETKQSPILTSFKLNLVKDILNCQQTNGRIL